MVFGFLPIGYAQRISPREVPEPFQNKVGVSLLRRSVLHIWSLKLSQDTYWVNQFQSLASILFQSLPKACDSEGWNINWQVNFHHNGPLHCWWHRTNSPIDLTLAFSLIHEKTKQNTLAATHPQPGGKSSAFFKLHQILISVMAE